MVALIAEVLQSMERDTTTASLLAAAGAAWHLMALLASDRSTGDGRYAAIDRAAEYLRTHIDDHVSVAELAVLAPAPEAVRVPSRGMNDIGSSRKRSATVQCRARRGPSNLRGRQTGTTTPTA